MVVSRVERHTINKNHAMYKACDSLCFKAKNMYNYANYIIRQEFISNRNVIKYNDLTFQLKHSEPFKDLGSNSAQHTLKMLCKDWKSFLVAVKDYSKRPHKYLGKPRIPKYKKKDGRHICVLTNMQSQIKDGCLYFAFKELKAYNNLINTKIQGHHMQTRIVPNGGCYILEIVYEKEAPTAYKEHIQMASIDLGLNNFATLTNNIGVKPIIINGKGIKSYNQYWNKEMAKAKSVLKKNNDMNWSNKLERLTDKRNNIIENFTHQSSRYIINWCVCYGIDTIVIGKNDGWKQECKMSTKTNQHFVQIPYNIFISKLKYKCEDVGINFIETEESYTSGTSFLDNELPIKENYNKGRRIHRGLFKSNVDKKINADINGSLQIMKKVFPNAFADGIEGLDLIPAVVNVI